MSTLLRFSSFALLSLILVACNENNTAATKTQTLETLKQKASYSFGIDIATPLKAQDIDLDVDALNRGISDAFSGKKQALTTEEQTTAKDTFRKTLQEQLQNKMAGKAKENLAKGKAFLAENAKKDGVVTTASGLQYKIIKKGDGAQPTATDTVTTHYHGTLIDGREFDSSIKRNTPATFPVSGVIKGWTEALQLMHVGDKWQLFIPPELAYGDTQRSALIEGNATLIFDIELLSIKGDKSADTEKASEDKAEKK